MIKRMIAFPVSWMLFGIGHAVSYLLQWKYTFFVYPIYTWHMLKSYDVQEWGDVQRGPWE